MYGLIFSICSSGSDETIQRLAARSTGRASASRSSPSDCAPSPSLPGSGPGPPRFWCCSTFYTIGDSCDCGRWISDCRLWIAQDGVQSGSRVPEHEREQPGDRGHLADPEYKRPLQRLDARRRQLLADRQRTVVQCFAHFHAKRGDLFVNRRSNLSAATLSTCSLQSSRSESKTRSDQTWHHPRAGTKRGWHSTA